MCPVKLDSSDLITIMPGIFTVVFLAGKVLGSLNKCGEPRDIPLVVCLRRNHVVSLKHSPLFSVPTAD
jgi:hypothetical protein